MCDFPWILSNVRFEDGSPIADALQFVIIEHAGLKIGFIGLAEEEWIATLPKFDPDDLDFLDPIVVAEDLSAKLSMIYLI
jgi:5'-nucleotidase